MYVAKFAERIYVLRVFQKKTQKDSALTLELTRSRLAAVRRPRREDQTIAVPGGEEPRVPFDVLVARHAGPPVTGERDAIAAPTDKIRRRYSTALLARNRHSS